MGGLQILGSSTHVKVQQYIYIYILTKNSETVEDCDNQDKETTDQITGSILLL